MLKSLHQGTTRTKLDLRQEDLVEAQGYTAVSPQPTFAFAGAILPGRYTRGANGYLIEVEPSRPCPELLTEDEASLYLRLNVKNPGDTLRYYREHRGLRAVQISRQVLYPRKELDTLWHRLMEENPR
ncbi:MAG: helix-turn-helix domain-containing protein [Planctomycetota bacterium]